VAVGGGGIPFELDLAPTGDPWRDWSDPTQRPSAAIDRGRPSDEIDRIRNEVRRRTDSDVVREALRRRPELADRLERLDRRDRRNDEPSDPAGDGRAPGLVNGLPAALDPAERGPGRRNLLDRIGSEREPGRDLGEDIEEGVRRAGDRTVDGERPLETIRVEGLEMNASQMPSANDPMGFSLEDLDLDDVEGLGQGGLTVLIQALGQARDDVMTGSGGNVTEQDFWDATEANLILNGMNPLAAENLINQLIDE